MFNEPELNALEEQLNINNQNIAQYFQNFMAARAQVREARAGYFPTVTARFLHQDREPPATASAAAARRTGQRRHGSPTTEVPPARVVSLPFDVSWEPDLWGRIRNTVQ